MFLSLNSSCSKNISYTISNEQKNETIKFSQLCDSSLVYIYVKNPSYTIDTLPKDIKL